MKRIIEMIKYIIKAMYGAVSRFPLTVASLSGAAVLLCYMISIHRSPPLSIEKMMFTLLVGAFLGMTAQFSVERFDRLIRLRMPVYGAAALLTAGYFLILWPAPEISAEIGVRTMVAVFALLCAVLWVPSFKNRADFNQIALVHFKSACTSLLYSGVLAAGMAAIIATIDILLFDVHQDTYSYIMVLIWVLFAPIYYLSLLPRFNSEDEFELEKAEKAKSYPKFLEILVSFIAVPLVAVYTLVLFTYFIKILVTLTWPSGQLGPMVLIYSAAGLVLFILASLLENRFALLYRRIFPKVLIPIVIMQLISVSIRLNAYGVTESRYYVALFGIFSIVIGIILSIKPVVKNSYIALLATAFAILSIIPPIDAFTISRVSQIARVESILQAEGILHDGKLTPKENASEETKVETTNILSYLDRQSSLKYIDWLPEDFEIYRDLETVIGFEPTYPHQADWESKYYYVGLDSQKPLIISDYDIALNIHSTRYIKEEGTENTTQSIPFTLEDNNYELVIERISQYETILTMKDADGKELVQTGLYDFIQRLAEPGNEPKEMLSPEKLTLEVTQNGYKLKVVFQNVNMNLGDDSDAGVDYTAIVLFGDSN